MNIRHRLLLRRIRRDEKSLTEVSLIDAKIGPIATCKLTHALKNNTHVKTLWLAGNNMGDEGSEAIAELLRCNKVIRQIILSVNGIGPTGALSLASVLEDDEEAVLEVLCMGGNNLGDKGAMFLAEMLRTNTSLKELWLRDNNLTSKSANALAQNLKNNGALQELWLGGNELGDEGATALAGALQGSASESNTCALSVLDLSNNGVTAVGACILLEAVTSNQRITKLDLSGNDIADEEILRKIDSILQRNRKLGS